METGPCICKLFEGICKGGLDMFGPLGVCHSLLLRQCIAAGDEPHRALLA